jgi:O-antigen ligase
VGAGLLLVACLVAVRDVKAPVFTWPNLIALLVIVVWFIPIRLYTIAISLPFNLEVYRVLLLVLILALLVAVVARRRRLDAAGHGKPMLLLAGVFLASFILNAGEVDQTEGVKSLSFLLSYLIVFVLVTSVVDTVEQMRRIMAVLVLGAAVIAAAALYEGQSGYNVFDHLNQWIPLLEQLPRDVFEIRGGRLRVFASAQHPIALGAALMMMLPVAAYLMSSARSQGARRLWIVAGIAIAAGAFSTVSRTTVAMGVVGLVVALLLRGRRVVRYWPAVVVLGVVVHVSAPGAIGALWASIFPEEGLVTELGDRAGQGGSGRLADIEPGLELWSQSPLVGHGPGNETGFTITDPAQVSLGQKPPTIIFDNQYMSTLVALGILGVIGMVWWVGGGAVKLYKAAKRTTGEVGDFIAACAISCAGFAVALLLFDGFFTVQATLTFVFLAALGLRAASQVRRQESEVPSVRADVLPAPSP